MTGECVGIVLLGGVGVRPILNMPLNYCPDFVSHHPTVVTSSSPGDKSSPPHPNISPQPQLDCHPHNYLLRLCHLFRFRLPLLCRLPLCSLVQWRNDASEEEARRRWRFRNVSVARSYSLRWEGAAMAGNWTMVGNSRFIRW